MKRSLILFMILGVIAGSMTTAEASKKSKTPARSERTVEGTYGAYPSPVTGCNDPLGSWACMSVSTRTTERSFTAKVTDAHGLPVFVEVEAFLWGSPYDVARFCGETTEPIRFHPESDLVFYVGQPNWDAQTDCPANSVKTTGTISVTLSNYAPAKPASIQAPPEPERSGSIISGTGWLLDSEMGGCQMSPECAVWLDNSCEERLAGWKTGLTASIVNVDELADGPPVERVFEFGSGEPWAPVYGGAHLQFWTRDCEEIQEARWRSTDCDGDASGRDCWSHRFLIPPAAKWMTVTGYQDNVNLTWTLN